MATGAQSVRRVDGGGDGDIRRDVGSRGAGTSDHRGGDNGWGRGKGDDQVGEGGGYSSTRFLRRGRCRRGGISGGVPDPERGGGGYHSIGLVGMIWKAVAVIINRRFTAAITYHNFLHGFRSGRGTGTATLEVNLLQ